MSIFDFGVDLWIELIISNELSNQDIFNLTTTCKFFSQFLKNEKLLQFIEDRNIYFGFYQDHKTYQSYEQLLSIAWSADKKLIATGAEYEKKVCLWNTKTGKIKKILSLDDLEDQSGISYLAFHPQKTNLLCVAFEIGSPCLWDIEKSKIATKFDDLLCNQISCIILEPRGRFFVCGGTHAVTRIWNTETGQCEKELTGLTSSVAFSKDAKFLAASDNVDIFIWNFETFEIVQQIKTDNDSRFHTISFQLFDDNQTLVLIKQQNNFVKFYDFKSGKEKKEMSFESKNRGNYKIILHPNQKIIALGGRIGLEIWDIQAKKLLQEKGGVIADLSFSPNGKALAVAFSFTFQVFDMKKYL